MASVPATRTSVVRAPRLRAMTPSDLDREATEQARQVAHAEAAEHAPARTDKRRRPFPWSLIVANGDRYQHRFLPGGEAVMSSTVAEPGDYRALQQAVVAD